MGFFRNVFDFVDCVIYDAKELKVGIKEVVHESKRDIISDLKRDAPPVGNIIEKADRFVTTYKNTTEQLPVSTLSTIPQWGKLLKNANKYESQAVDSDTITRAKHLQMNRLGYLHHALSLGDSTVIHYQDGMVKIESIEHFAKGAAIHIVSTTKLYHDEKIIARAYSRLGESEYNLIFNNCEHFVSWAMNGD